MHGARGKMKHIRLYLISGDTVRRGVVYQQRLYGKVIPHAILQQCYVWRLAVTACRGYDLM